jgi:hypothetical protein
MQMSYSRKVQTNQNGLAKCLYGSNSISKATNVLMYLHQYSIVYK